MYNNKYYAEWDHTVQIIFMPLSSIFIGKVVTGFMFSEVKGWSNVASFLLSSSLFRPYQKVALYFVLLVYVVVEFNLCNVMNLQYFDFNLILSYIAVDFAEALLLGFLFTLIIDLPLRKITRFACNYDNERKRLI